jgi:hypothetical protein
MRRIISSWMRFTPEIFKVLGQSFNDGAEISKLCIKIIEHSFQLMNEEDEEEFLKKVNGVSEKVNFT